MTMIHWWRLVTSIKCTLLPVLENQCYSRTISRISSNNMTRHVAKMSDKTNSAERLWRADGYISQTSLEDMTPTYISYMTCVRTYTDKGWHITAELNTHERRNKAPRANHAHSPRHKKDFVRSHADRQPGLEIRDVYPGKGSLIRDVYLSIRDVY